MSKLTEKQEAVMSRKAQGLTNKEIANILNLSEPAIQDRISTAVKNLGARNAMHGVSLYVQGQMFADDSLNSRNSEETLTTLQILLHLENQIAELGLEPIAAAKRLEIIGAESIDEFLYDQNIMEYVSSMLSLVSGIRQGK